MGQLLFDQGHSQRATELCVSLQPTMLLAAGIGVFILEGGASQHPLPQMRTEEAVAQGVVTVTNPDVGSKDSHE